MSRFKVQYLLSLLELIANWISFYLFLTKTVGFISPINLRHTFKQYIKDLGYKIEDSIQLQVYQKPTSHINCPKMPEVRS